MEGGERGERGKRTSLKKEDPSWLRRLILMGSEALDRYTLCVCVCLSLSLFGLSRTVVLVLVVLVVLEHCVSLVHHSVPMSLP